MEYYDKLIEEAVLALLAEMPGKGFDFMVMNRLHEVNKNKSVG